MQDKEKIIGIIPARMAASRFPGKPMSLIHGRTMIEHVFLRAKIYPSWDYLALATCDQVIENHAIDKNIPVIMTGNHHIRALDRVAEAIDLLTEPIEDRDIVVCVQGDEPMLRPNMIDAVVDPLLNNPAIPGTILAMHIADEAIWKNPDTVKIIHNDFGEVLYTSRAPLPYCKGSFTPELMARRIYGIFAFRWVYLKKFTAHPETRLERLESCDSNRILDMNFRQFIAPYPAIKSFSVDSPEDLLLVEQTIRQDECWGLYN
ncbi:KdsB CMP-2-keto-3-deoxyoctulosonic acid synthetase [Burkholderiaceae bacterium]